LSSPALLCASRQFSVVLAGAEIDTCCAMHVLKTEYLQLIMVLLFDHETVAMKYSSLCNKSF
jgi:hypothetical protein